MKRFDRISIFSLFFSLCVFSTVGFAAEKELQISLHDGVIAQKEKTFRVRKGDKVTIHWTSDVPLELHLHGYNLTTKLRPGGAVTTSFIAHTLGRFPVEKHGGSHEREQAKPGRRLQIGKADTAVLYIEVRP